jgi:hypothetical protein
MYKLESVINARKAQIAVHVDKNAMYDAWQSKRYRSHRMEGNGY